MADIQDLDPTDANNTGRWPEGMLGGDINDAGRAMEGYLSRWYRDISGVLAATGSSNAFALTSSRTISSLFDGLRMTFRANHAITGAATLNLNGLGAKDIKRFNGSALASGDIISGQPVDVIYSSALDDWLMVSALAALVGSMFADFGENGAPGNPAADTARLYAKDVNGLTQVAYRDSAGTEYVLDVIGKSELVAIIEDQKTSGTSPQTLTSGADNIRELNTLVYNRSSLVSLSSNRFTLPTGTWEIEWFSPMFAGGSTAPRTQSFLYNQSDASEVARGTVATIDCASGTFSTDASTGRTTVTIASSKAFEIRHRAEDFSQPGGRAGSMGTEVYTRVSVRRA